MATGGGADLEAGQVAEGGGSGWARRGKARGVGGTGEEDTGGGTGGVNTRGGGSVAIRIDGTPAGDTSADVPGASGAQPLLPGDRLTPPGEASDALYFSSGE